MYNYIFACILVLAGVLSEVPEHHRPRTSPAAVHNERAISNSVIGRPAYIPVLLDICLLAVIN